MANKESKTALQVAYNPKPDEQEKISFVYEEFQEMQEVMNQQYPELNDRTLQQYLDDCQKRANSYVPPRDLVNKEEWQANIFTKLTRNKIKAHIASVSKTVPAIKMKAVDENNQVSMQRAGVMKELVRGSYLCNSNPEVVLLMDGWSGSIDGTKIKYDGYLRTQGKVKTVKSYDWIIGEIETEEVDAQIDDQPIEIDVPVQNLMVKNPYIFDIQDQPAMIWVQYYDEGQFDAEFGKFKNSKYVQEGASTLTAGENQLFFGDQWMKRVPAKRYEVLKYYNKYKDIYRVIANGVLLLDTPILWGKKKKKYPFAKSIFEPFANINFFWGNSLANILMDDQDVANAFINSLIDKTYRSVETPMLVGTVNRDAFDLEDEYVSGDTKIYVPDINQVKPMPIDGVNQAEISMWNIVKQGANEASTDSVQGGTSGSGSTAREIVIANERAEELKGMYYTFLKDLWLQKYRLRTLNILMNYNQPKVTLLQGEESGQIFQEQFKNYNVPNSELSNGEQGTLQVQVVGSRSEFKSPRQIEVEEEMQRIEGHAVEIVQITSDYLDNWEYTIEMETESFYQKSKALDMAMETEKIQMVAQLFPEIFMSAKEEFFKALMKRYGDDATKYLEKMQQPQMGMMGGGMPQDGMGLPNTMASVAQPAQQVPKLPNLSGV